MAQTIDYDVIIVGAGPSGSTCAMITQKAGLKTLILEKESFPRSKLCAGLLFITGPGEKIVDAIYPDMPDEVYAFPQILEGPKMHYDGKLIVNSKNKHRNYDRARLDHWLAKNSKADISYRTRFIDYSINNVAITVECEQDAVRKTFSCRFLVGAEGDNPSVVQRLYPQELANSARIVIKQAKVSGTINLEKRFFYIFMKKGSFANYVVSKDDSWVLGVGGKDSDDVDTEFQQLWQFLKHDLGLNGEIIEERYRYANDIWLNPLLGKDNVLLVGETAGFWGRGGDGIWFGIESGRLCGESIVDSIANGGAVLNCYREKIRTSSLEKQAYLLHGNVVALSKFHRAVDRTKLRD